MNSSFFGTRQAQTLLNTAIGLCQYYQPAGTRLNTEPVERADRFTRLAQNFCTNLGAETLGNERHARLGLLIEGMSGMQKTGSLEQWHVNSFVETLGTATLDSHQGTNSHALFAYIQMTSSIQRLLFFSMNPSAYGSKNADRLAVQAALDLKKSLLFFLKRDSLGGRIEKTISDYCTVAEGNWGLDSHDTVEFIGELTSEGFFPKSGETKIAFLSRLLGNTERKKTSLHVVLDNGDQITSHPSGRYSVRYHQGALTGKVVSFHSSPKEMASYLKTYVIQTFPLFRKYHFDGAIFTSLIEGIFQMVFGIQQKISGNQKPVETIEIVREAWRNFYIGFRSKLELFLQSSPLKEEIVEKYDNHLSKHPDLPDDFALLLARVLS